MTIGTVYLLKDGVWKGETLNPKPTNNDVIVIDGVTYDPTDGVWVARSEMSEEVDQELEEKSHIIVSAIEALEVALKILTEQRGARESSSARYFAIAITDLEKLVAFVEKYC